ncbi:MAG: sulfotransferase family protein, partial [Mycobacterium sp.]
TWLKGPNRWVMKSPPHMENLRPLISTYPDATVIVTHRDPVAVIQSAITMMAYSDRLRRRSIEPQWLLDYWADRVERLLRGCVRDRALVPAERSVDIGFHRLNGHEFDLLDDLYARADVELTSKVRRAFPGYLDSNPRGKHGSVRYELQRHFGVSPDELRSQFAFYFERFDVRPEGH